jgi:hypothetical protein
MRAEAEKQDSERNDDAVNLTAKPMTADCTLDEGGRALAAPSIGVSAHLDLRSELFRQQQLRPVMTSCGHVEEAAGTTNSGIHLGRHVGRDLPAAKGVLLDALIDPGAT